MEKGIIRRDFMKNSFHYAGPAAIAGIMASIKATDLPRAEVAYPGKWANLKDSLILCDWCFPRILGGFLSKEERKATKDYHRRSHGAAFGRHGAVNGSGVRRSAKEAVRERR